MKRLFQRQMIMNKAKNCPIMHIENDNCRIGVVNGKIQTILDIHECSTIPCISIKTNEQILGDRNLKEITYIAPKRLECNKPLMIKYN